MVNNVDRAIFRALLAALAVFALLSTSALPLRADPPPGDSPPNGSSDAVSESAAPSDNDDPVLAQDPNITHIGAPVTTRHVRNTLVAMEDGHPMYYAVFRGSGATEAPATFVVADALTGDIVRTFPLQGADTAMELRPNQDRSKIYFVTTTDNNLYEYDTGSGELRKVGPVNPESPRDGNVWSLTAAEDGKMYMGSYPNALLYLYDPADDSIENLGQLDDTQAYVYTLAYDFETGNLYAATGGVAAQVWKITPDGTQTALLNEENAPGATTSQFISTFTFVDGLLFARGDNSSLLVIDRDDEVKYWTGAGREAFGYQVTPNPMEEGKLVMTTPAGLAEYDANSHTIRDLGLSGHGVLNDALWLELDDPQFPGLTMVAATNAGATLYNPQNATSTSFPVDYENPVTVQKILNGPDGSIYASGYPTGLTSIGKTPGEFGETLQAGQFESAVVRDGKMLLGAYGYGKLMEFDPATGAAPRQIFDLRVEEQDRPFGLTYDEANDRLFMATVPYYGTNQGALTVYDFATEEKTVYTDEIVEEQSVIDVLYHDGLVYLGTTLDGGLSAPPSGQTEAHFIVFDPDTGTVVDDIVPVTGDEGVTGLMVGPDGLIWGVSEDTVFKYDPASGEIVFSEAMLGARYGNSTVWAWAYLAIGADGNVYGSNRSSIFRIDPETMDYTKIVEGAGNYLKADGNGDLYFSRGVNVYRYSVPRVPTEPVCDETLTGQLNQRMAVGDGSVLCLDEATINGAVTVSAGGTLVATDSSFRGGLTADGAAGIQLRGNDVRGPAQINGTSGSLVIAGNAFHSGLSCTGNAAAPVDEDAANRVSGRHSGQCAEI